MIAIGKRAIFRLAKMLRRRRFFEKPERGTRDAGRGKGKVKVLRY
jgi:hypothetical protein